jgi:murein DD-endopeptidase MepM/ murein hydrolase activator NlpD
MEKTKKDKNSKLNRWLATYRFVILNEQSYEETFSYKLNRLNVFLFFSVSILLLIISTFLVISYTPLKEYIPGYDSSELRRKAIMNNYKLDSIQEKLMRNQRYIIAVSEVLKGDLDIYELEQRVNSDTIYSNKSLLEFKTSEADSLLRIEVESDEKYNITQTGEDKSLLTLFKPISGKVTQNHDPTTRHYAVDIATKLNTPVRATTEGVVVFSGWSDDAGYVVIIDHPYDLLSVYKHNSSISVSQGEVVEQGQVIAFSGNSGMNTTGPHLHFEIWSNGFSLNPEEFIDFN